MPSPRKPTTGFWIVVALVVLLAAYPLSFGPAIKLNHGNNGPFNKFIMVAYQPFVWIYAYSPKPVQVAVKWYTELWLAPRVAFNGQPDSWFLLVPERI